MSFELPKLDYSYDALEPYFDAETMEVHHSKHHQGYTDKLNAALSEHTELAEQSAERIITNLDSVPEEIRQAVRNSGGGYINHNLFWQTLTPPKEGQELPDIDITHEIKNKYGSYESFVETFTAAASSHFGSGWIWLVVDKDGQLEITTTVNQDSPFTDGKTPILTLDVWEHAYYLKYQNRRPEYIEAWWNIVNWQKVNELYEAAMNQ